MSYIHTHSIHNISLIFINKLIIPKNSNNVMIVTYFMIQFMGLYAYAQTK